MREIKFRVWDAEIEEMHDWESLIPSVDMGYLLSNNDEEYDEYRIMQYTGLKDKYGVEIYEGDIVISQDGTGGLVYKHIVEWNEFYKRFEPMGEDEAHFNRESCEIIGNIYENPELLEGNR